MDIKGPFFFYKMPNGGMVSAETLAKLPQGVRDKLPQKIANPNLVFEKKHKYKRALQKERRERQRLEKKLAGISKKSRGRPAHHHESEEELERLQQTYEAKVKEVREKFDGEEAVLNFHIEALQTEHDKLQEEFEKANSEYDSLETEYDFKTKELERMQERVALLEQGPMPLPPSPSSFCISSGFATDTEEVPINPYEFEKINLLEKAVRVRELHSKLLSRCQKEAKLFEKSVRELEDITGQIDMKGPTAPSDFMRDSLPVVMAQAPSHDLMFDPMPLPGISENVFDEIMRDNVEHF